MNTKKITIAIPTNRNIQPQTVESLMKLVTRGGYNFHIIVAENGYTVAENRNYIVVQAIVNNSDFLIMIDDDMTLEETALDKLIANNKDICGVAYHPRTGGDRTKCITSLAEVNKKEFINLETNKNPKYKTLFECYATGTGVILIKTDVFKKIPQPWFEFKYFKTGQCKEGEDWNFCIKAKKHGYKIWTDPRIKVGHLGEMEYKKPEQDYQTFINK